MTKVNDLFADLMAQLPQIVEAGIKESVAIAIKDVVCPNGHQNLYKDIEVVMDHELEKGIASITEPCCQEYRDLVEGIISAMSEEEK